MGAHAQLVIHGLDGIVLHKEELLLIELNWWLGRGLWAH